MNSAHLPVHPIFGRAIGLRRNGAPIWPIAGGSGEGDPPEGGTAVVDQPPVTPVPTDDEELGDGGKKALAAERRARTAAEKAKTALEAKVAAFEDAQKTEAERTAERIANLEKDAAKALRYEAAEQAKLPLSMAKRLSGNTLEELIADAEVLKQDLGTTAPNPETPPVPPAPKPDRRQGGGEADTGGSMAAGKALYEARKSARK